MKERMSESDEKSWQTDILFEFCRTDHGMRIEKRKLDKVIKKKTLKG